MAATTDIMPSAPTLPNGGDLLGILANLNLNINQILVILILGFLLIVAIFGTLAVIISLLNYEENPVRDRLQAFKEKGVFEKTNRKADAFDDMMESFIIMAGPIGQALYGKTAKQI